MAKEELILLCRAHVFKESKALRVLFAPFSASPTVHEVAQRGYVFSQLACAQRGSPEVTKNIASGEEGGKLLRKILAPPGV